MARARGTDGLYRRIAATADAADGVDGARGSEGTDAVMSASRALRRPASWRPPPKRRSRAAGLVGAAALALSFAGLAAQAQAALISSFEAGVLKDENYSNPQPADYATQAASHPDVAFTNFSLDTALGSAEFVRVDLPPGLSVNPQAIPRCTATGTTLDSKCPKDTQVGVSRVKISTLLGTQEASAKVYNMAPPNGSPGDFAFEVTILLIAIRTDLVAGVRYYPSNGQPGDYGEYFTISGISNTLGSALGVSELDFWGAPEEHNGGGATNNAFLTNPTVCNGPQTTHLFANTYPGLFGEFVSELTSFTTPTGAEGCASIPFNPSVSVTPGTTQRDKPDGVALDVHVPQDLKPSDIASSQLEEATVALPEGLTLNPSAANGLSACTEAQFGQETNNAIACPASSEVGTAEIDTPVLGSALTGKLYVGQPLSTSPESGEEYRLFLDAENTEAGVKIRLIGKVAANASTGRLTATFANAPQLPFEDLKLHFNNTQRALLANSLACGSAKTTTTLTPYSGNAAATPSSTFTVDNNGSGGSCPTTLPFAPATSATLSSKVAGANTSLTLDIGRADGESTLSRLAVTLPEGLVANLSAVKLCAEPQAAAGSCSEESKIGTATITAGAGSEPLSLSGTVYLTTGYKGATFGLAIVVPALAGPYNLGTVVVRAAVAFNTVNGQLTITSDALPTILSGVPLRLKNVKVEINRSGFLVNPTTCSAASISGSVTSTSSQSTPISSPVTFEGCAALPFSPTLSLTPSTTREDQPLGLAVDIQLPTGSAELHGATVTLPSGVTLNPAVGSGLEACTEAELGIGTSNPVTCPAASAVGSVEIATPLLSAPLTGSLYVGQPIGSNPESGEEFRLFVNAESAAYGFAVRLIGKLDVNKESGRMTATFSNTPPLPFTEMKLAFRNGARAPLASPQACGAAAATSSLSATNGASSTPGASFTVNEGAAGGSCPATLPFAPTATATLGSGEAGAASSLTLAISRADSEQGLSSVTTKLPPGLLGMLSTITPCAEPAASEGTCAQASAIGTTTVSAGVGAEPLALEGKVYLTDAYEGSPYGLAIVVPATAGPYDLGTVVVRAAVAVDTAHGQLTITTDPLPTIVGGVPLRLRTVTVKINRAGFMVNPSSCSALAITGTVTSLASASQPFSSGVHLSGCESLPFAPTLSVTPATTQRDTPTGLAVDVHLPAGDSDLEAATVSFPAGLSINPSAANGLQSCTDAQFHKEGGTVECPAASQVGSVEITTPVLAHALTGKLYVGQPLSTNPESGEEYRLFVNAEDVPDGLAVRLVGAVRANASTGQLTSTFTGLPPVPFSDLDLSFNGGSSALFANPAGCGSASTQAQLTPTSGGSSAHPSSAYTVDEEGSGGACPAQTPFEPTVTTTISSHTARAGTNLTLALSRADGEQTVSGITAKLPEGLLADLGAVKLCEEPQAAAGTCSAESRIGTVGVEAGAGSTPLSLAGSAYLTKAYKEAPLGLSLVVPAIAGPYDLGTVVVRAQVALDTVHGQLTVTTDPLPTIVGGVPLRLRNLTLEVNRAGFLVNPSSCAAAAATGSVGSTGGATQTFSDPLAIEGCGSLPFAPSIALTPTTTRSDTPTGMTVDMRLGEGDAALQTAVIHLPSGLSLNPPAAEALEGCTDSELGVGSSSPVTCPAASQVGNVEITTPLLPSALTGKLYVGAPKSSDPESGEEYRLFLNAESAQYGIAVRMVGALAANASTGALTATFADAPPIPFTEMKLTLTGAKGGLFANPLACGAATTTTTLTPYSGGTDATPSSLFTVDSNGSGGSCPSQPPFEPSVSTSFSSKSARASTGFALSLTRSDGEQLLGSLTTKLPEGILANLSGVKLCEEPQAAAGTCPEESRIGTATVTAGAGSEPLSLAGKVYLTSRYGEGALGLSIAVPAAAGPYDLGTVVVRAAVFVDTVHGQITIKTDPLPTVVGGIQLRLRHVAVEVDRAGLLLNPNVCTPLQLEGSLASATGQSQSLGAELTLEGCSSLSFAPTLSVTPSTTRSDSPVGMTVDLQLPAESEDLHRVEVTLPPGVSLNPAVAQGLEACSDAQFGLGTDDPVACPSASAVGTVEISSPLLPEALTGSVYVGEPKSSDPESGEEYRLFVNAESPTYGISVRLLGALSANARSGQLEATFANAPPLPFTNMKLTLAGGARAALANPEACGQATSEGVLTSSLEARVTQRSSYTVDADGEGGACPTSAPFTPTVGISEQSSLAGAFDPIAFDFSSGEQQQKLGAITTVLPPGLIGELATAARCGEPAAASGSCPAESRIGTATVSAGTGPSPLQLSGSVYLTGPYDGAPFGLAIVVPAIAGPYNLGVVVVRASVAVDPNDAQVTIATDPLPTILGGVPLRLAHVALAVERSGFIVNPTSCAASDVTAQLVSDIGTSASGLGAFDVSGCESLAFEPSLSATTSVPSSRSEGASLTVGLSYPTEHEANLAAVQMTLPSALASRASTLQQACLEATFDAQPSSCPSGSAVGEATVLTPALPDPLTGTAYLVATPSGGFPELDLVLSADGVRLVLRGQTDIKSGITSAAFSSLPDVPIRSLSLTLPAGPDSLLGTTAEELCEAPLLMPTVLTAQNGSQLTRQVTLAVTGCPPGTGASGGAGALAKLRLTPTRFRAASAGASIANVSAAGVLEGSATTAGAHSKRRRAHAGATVSYTDSAPGTTTFTIERLLPGERRGRRCVAPAGHHGRPRHGHASCVRAARVVVHARARGEKHGGACVARSAHGGHGRACTLHMLVASFVHADRPGADSFHFSGRLGGHKLAPGAYRLIARARYGTTTSAPVSARFWITRP